MASNNMYRVGDFVYFESSATAPYQIRRIDELNKTPTGAVEAKVACYFRRRDVSSALVNQAEKYYVTDEDSDQEDADTKQPTIPSTDDGDEIHPRRNKSGLTEVQKHQLKHRELFLSRQIECLPATHIRGKCSVTLYNDAEPLTNYLARDEAFYYKLIYDPSLKTLQEDRGAMRIGSDHQSEIQCLLKSKSDDPRLTEIHEELVWTSSHSLTDQEIDMFCLLARAVGTLGRAHDNSSTVRQPLLLNAVASAGRDITRQHAHDILHEANYDLAKALTLLIPGGRPVIYRDQLEDWSASEAHLFEEALDKYSKVFSDILADYLPWKTHKSIVELYYFWKTTDRYVRQRRTKLAAQEHKLKQVYIPNYSKPNPAVLYNGSDKNGRPCEGCGASNSPQWYAWGPPNMCRICAGCWSYWKRYGGLKNPEVKAGINTSFSSGTTSRPHGHRSHAERASSLRNQQINDVDVKSGGPIKITGSINHQFRSHSIGIPSSENTPDYDSLSTTPLSVPSSIPKHMDGLGFLTNLMTGSPRGTLCFRTPPFIRLARILCPEFIRPFRLARRPGKHASSTGTKRLPDASSIDLVSENGQSLNFHVLKSAAQPMIARLANPSSLLIRTRNMPPLDGVVKSIAARKGISLDTSNVSLLFKSNQPNGPLLPANRKRPHSPVVSDEHLAKKLDRQTKDKQLNNGIQSTCCSLSENTSADDGLPNGNNNTVFKPNETVRGRSKKYPSVGTSNPNGIPVKEGLNELREAEPIQ